MWSAYQIVVFVLGPYILDGNSGINLQGDNFERVNTFKYLGAALAENGDLDVEMTHSIQSGWKTGRGYRGFSL